MELGETSALAPAVDDLPNVVIIVLDTVRARHMSVYGYPRETTPNLQNIKEQGVVFERAYSTAPWTLPSHASLFTGCWPHEHQANWDQSLGEDYPVVAEYFKGLGYDTAGFVANLLYCARSSGLGRGFIHYEDYPISLGQVLLSSSLGREIDSADRLRNLTQHHELLNRKSASDITSAFLNWLSGRKRRKFFAFLNYYDAHQPCFPPHPYDVEFGPRHTWSRYHHGLNQADPANMWEMSPSEVQGEIDAYDGAILYIDDSLGRLFNELLQRDLFDNTLIIITSDHGEQFGEHGLFGHTNSLYIQNLHVPLMMVCPKLIPKGVVVTDPVSLRDIPSTLAALTGTGMSLPFPGIPLSHFWEAEMANTSEPEMILSELTASGFDWQNWYPTIHGDMRAVFQGDFHFIQRGDGSEELYNLAEDQDEEHDIIGTPVGQRVSRDCRRILASL